MTPDSELLAAFSRTNSEDAFGELVQRHVHLVYSAALRQVNGDEHFAKDVAQTVFTDLARKAGSLARRESLTGWLYTSAHFAAAKIIRAETRRRDREEKFMREPVSENSETARNEDWEKIRPALDAAMHELKAADREAILLRYFENRPFAEVGAKLGLNENAARMRVERALEKLRLVFAKRGIAGTSALAAVISANAVQLAPTGLSMTLTTASITAAGTGTFTLLKIMTATKLKLGVSALVVAGAAAALVIQHQTQNQLHVENGVLQQQIAQLRADNEEFSNRLAAAGDAKKLPDEQFNELLKLRGEVGVLRNQANDLNHDNAMLKKRLTEVSNLETNLAPVLQVHVKSRFITVPKDSFSIPGATGNGLTGILTYQNFTNMYALLKKRDGVEVLAEPEVTSTSGRQTQMRATQVITVITNFALVESNGTSAVVPQSCQVETGPIVDVVPQILPDGRTITLPVTASVTDFLGYEQPTNNPVPSYTKDGEEVDVPQVLPQFRVQTASAKVNIWDDQTLVLKLPDKQVPSDAFLQSSNDPKLKDGLKETLAFITVTIVDSAGNRKNESDESDSIPDQPAPPSN
jgi:RNA polymerase sigma factor (sigma-70 family)